MLFRSAVNSVQATPAPPPIPAVHATIQQGRRDSPKTGVPQHSETSRRAITIFWIDLPPTDGLAPTPAEARRPGYDDVHKNYILSKCCVLGLVGDAHVEPLELGPSTAVERARAARRVKRHPPPGLLQANEVRRHHRCAHSVAAGYQEARSQRLRNRRQHPDLHIHVRQIGVAT